MAHLRGHQEIYGGAEGLRHHLCLSHDEHREAGTPVRDLEDLHEEEHDYHPQHRGEYGCPEHTAEDEPGEFDDIHEQIGDIHRGIGVNLPDELHKFVHDRRRRPEDRAQALLDHVSAHPNHLGTHWTTEPHVAEDFGEKSAKGYATDRKPGTSVVFHANPPTLEDIDRDPHRWGNGDVYGYSEHGEREVPIRNPEGLDVKGISWAKVHSDWDTPGDREYTHHNLEGHEPRTAELLGHFEAAAARPETWYYGTTGEQDALDLGHDGVVAAVNADDDSRRSAAAFPQETDAGFAVDYSGKPRKIGINAHNYEKWYHLTDNPHFGLDKEHEPEDNSFALHQRTGKGIYLTKNPESWINGHDYVRPYVAEFHAHPGLREHDTNGRWGDEMFVPAEHFDKLHLHRVIPVDAHAREEFGEYGWIEDHHGRDFHTGEYLHEPDGGYRRPAFTRPYRYKGPDVREMDPHYHDSMRDDWLSYMKDNRGFSDEDIDHYRQQNDAHRTAASRPGRGEDSCSCCSGQGEHTDGSSCARCAGSGRTGKRDRTPHCPGQPQPKRRHWRENVTASADDGGMDRMSVEDLLGLHSNEALRRERRTDPLAGHSDATRVRTLYDRKAAEMARNPAAWGQLDGPIRDGSIDPVLLETSSDGHTVVSEGQHRIVRAHQLGVTHLPVSTEPGSQAHRGDWDDPEPLDEPGQHTAAAFPPAERTESVRHILDHYMPYDFGTWDEVRDNNVWDHPKVKAFVDDIRRRGVLRPIPIDYEQDPPQVRNGHTRLLAAERAGIEHVPTRQHEGFMDPDDDMNDETVGRLHIPSREAAVDEPDTSYRMQHQGPDDGDGEALHEIGTRGTYPDDVLHHPDWYGAEHGETMDALHKSAGRPYRRVTIYRSLPAPHREINTGDWVATAAAYARGHGRATESADDWPVVKATVRADQIRSSGDSLEEWSYHGPPIRRAALHFGGGANQRGLSGRGRTDSATQEHEPPEMQAHYSRMLAEARPQRKAWQEKVDAWNAGQGEHPGQFRFQPSLEQKEAATESDPAPELLGHFEAAQDYFGGHRPMEGGAFLHDPENEAGIDEISGMGQDVYTHPEYYSQQGTIGPRQHEAVRQLRAARGNPDHPVTIYRASPADAPHSLHTGDWVALSRRYAENHADLHGDESWHVHSAVVPARHVRNGGSDIEEWGYWGPDVAAEEARPVSPSIGSREAAAEDPAPEPDYGQWPEFLRALRYRKRNEPEMHRGLAVDLPPDVHSYVMDENQTPDRQARAIVEHLRNRPLGMHWSANPKVSRDYARGEQDRQPGTTKVIVHARLPELEHIETDPDALHEGAVFRHDNYMAAEREIPIKASAPVHITGVTWYGYGNRKRRGNVYGMEHTAVAAAPEPPSPLYHGTDRDIAPGTLIEPGHAGNWEGNTADVNREHVYATPDASLAWAFGQTAGSEVHGDYHVQVREPRVYKVEPTGPVENDPEDKRGGVMFRSRHPLRVVSDETGRTYRKMLGIPEPEEGGHEVVGHFEAAAEPEPLNSLNPTGGLFVKYDPQSRASAPLGPNMTTLAETRGVHPDTPIRVYRGAPAGQASIVPGDFVTDHPQLARDYAGDGRVLSLDAAHGDVLDDRTEPCGGEYIYRPREKSGSAERTAALGAAAGQVPEYGPKPEHDWKALLDTPAGPEHDATFEQWHGEDRAWKSNIRRGLSMGHIDSDTARGLGYHGNGHEHAEPTSQRWRDAESAAGREPREFTGWQHLPQEMYHVTTDLPGVRAHGLKSREELGQMSGHGLGGGEDDTISLTSDPEMARHILRGMHEYHAALNDPGSPAKLWEQAKTGTGAAKSFHGEMARYYNSEWKDGDPLPRTLDAAVRGKEVKHAPVSTKEEMDAEHGPGWEPHRDAGHITTKDGRELYNLWERDAPPDVAMHQRSDLYKHYSYWRGHAGGPPDPLFISNDVHGFAARDPRHFGLLHVHPKPGAQGYPVTSMSEWRTTTGDALHVHRAEQLESGHLKEASLSREAAMYEPGLPNPHTGGHEWFHGSPHAFGGFGADAPDSPLQYEGDEEDTSHWNALLGHHFAASHQMAEGFSKGEHSPAGHGEEGPAENVVHARLELKNPKVYASEHDMDQEAYEHEWKSGNHHDGHHDPELASGEEDWDFYERPMTYQYAGHGDRMRAKDEGDPVYWEQNRQYHPYATGWLNSHPDKYNIAQRFKERLQAQGHDGIVYGNEFEKHHGTADNHAVCAIPFREHQIDVTQRHRGPDCIPGDQASRQWPGRAQPMLPFGEHQGALDVVAHFEALGAGPYFQQKLFHQQPDPTQLPEDSTRHNPADPLALVHHRQQHEEGYVPPRETWDHPEFGMRDEESGLYRHPEHGGYHCHACSRYQGEPVFHDDAETAENHNTAYTDWDEEYPRLPDTVHRGLRISGGSHLTDDLEGEHAARAVLRHVGDFGTHWTADENQARHYAVTGSGGRGGHDDLHVVIHARKPDREDIETDPETLADRNVYGIGYHDDDEIPLRDGAPVHVTGVTWRREGDRDIHTYPDTHGWQHHEFPQPAAHTALLEPADGDEIFVEAAADHRRQMADIGQSLLNFDKDMSDEDRQYFQDAINHARRGAPPSEPINAADAKTITRSIRAEDALGDAGWDVRRDVMRYPRGVLLNLGEHHRATLSPNSEGGWHVRTHPFDYGSTAPHIHHDLDTSDEDLPGALRQYYDSPQIRGEMASQRAEHENYLASRHEAALEAAPEVVKHFAVEAAADDDDWERRVIPPWNGERLMHGTRSILQPGDMLTHEDAARHANNPDIIAEPYVHATTRGEEAEEWGRKASPYQAGARAVEDGRQQQVRPGYGDHDAYRPRVYEVEPTGPVEPDPHKEGMAYRSAHPMRVVREVRPLECYAEEHEGEMHWPDHPHYQYLADEQAEDDDDDGEHTAALEATGMNGDRYVSCDQGHQHWGAYGAAGLLIRHQREDGQHEYLLQHRSPYVQHGDTWSTPGGALGSGESPEAGARREATEEFGELPEGITHHHTFTDDHGGWKYHTVVMDAPHRFEPRGGDEDWESEGHGWFTPHEMGGLDLHPGFAASWGKVQKSGALEATAATRNHWDMTDAQMRLHLRNEHDIADPAGDPAEEHWHEHSGDTQRHVHPDLEREFVREMNPGTPQGDAFSVRHVPHVESPRTEEDLRQHMRGHGWGAPSWTVSDLLEVHGRIHGEGNDVDHHHESGHHDPVFGSLDVVAHFDGVNHEDMDETQLRQHMRDRHGFRDTPDDPDWVIDETHRNEHADAPLEHSHPDLASVPDYDEEIHLGDKDWMHQNGIEASLQQQAASELAAHFEDGEEGDPEALWQHMREAHGVNPVDATRRPAAGFLTGLHQGFHSGQVADRRLIQHDHESQGGQPAQRPADLSRMWTPIPPDELEERRRAHEEANRPKPEPIDDRQYSLNDVSRHYDWEGFDKHEISHLVRNPERATFTHENVPVHSLRQLDEHGNLVHPTSYQDIAGQGEDEQERLRELERGYYRGDRIPPAVVVRDGEHHIIADGSHRAAVHAEYGWTHMPAFVTERTIHPGEHTASLQAVAGYDWATDDSPLEWDEIADRHPHVYGEGEEGDYDGPQIADAAAELYHDRPSHPHSQCTGECSPAYGNGGMLFHPRTVDPKRIDYMHAEPGDPRVRRAREGYESQRPERVPPLILVHRHGVFYPADGHHRANAADQIHKPVRAYVAYSPHDEPFAARDGDPARRGPFHGAELHDREPWPDQHGIRRRISYPGFPHAADTPPEQHTAMKEPKMVIGLPADKAHTARRPAGILFECMFAKIGAWQPDSLAEAREEVAEVPRLFRAIRDGLLTVAGRLDEAPLDPAFPEALRKMALSCLNAAEDARVMLEAPEDGPEGTWEPPKA